MNDELEPMEVTTEVARKKKQGRWVAGSKVARYGRDEQKLLDEINTVTPGYFRGARIPKGN